METNQLACGVYRIRNTVNGKAYVGSTHRTFRHRWRRHLSLLNRREHPNQHLQNAWDHYGQDAFMFEVLESVTDTHLIIEREDHWIQATPQHMRYNYGCAAAARLGASLSDESKQKMAESARRRWASVEERKRATTKTRAAWQDGETRERILRSRPKKYSELRRRALAEQMKKRWIERPDLAAKFTEGRQKAKQVLSKQWPPIISPDGTTHAPINMNEFARNHGLSGSLLRDLCHGRIKSYKGWRKAR